METIIDLVARMLVKKTLAQTQGAENSIAMLVLMNILNKNKFFTKIVINRPRHAHHGHDDQPHDNFSSTTWNRHLIVKPMLMLKTKVLKINLGEIRNHPRHDQRGRGQPQHDQDARANIGQRQQPRQDPQQHPQHEPSEASVHLQRQPNAMVGRARPPIPPQAARDEGIHPRRRNLEDEENMFGRLKFTMPKFKGEEDAEAYLSWALKVDKIFRIHNYSGAKKVAMASLEFEDYANTWWEQVLTLREEKGEPPIDTWEEMKEEMQARFVPTHYETALQQATKVEARYQDR
ncbi:hypothetical protein QYE76_027536 [Lolium multiflorum]|uniref:Retrotransposon gag domain-containing protein n=1 Tax=Lolium multiflorum TaxID=4521 RepID=A0AAD8QJ97_LOLMU|nr:hypothetical protein QYE76_027536 [Lolium multiflorum]